MPGRPAGVARCLLPVAASTTLLPVLSGPVVRARVVLSGRLAAYLSAPAGALAVVAASATAPPASAVLPAGIRPDALLASGDRVLVGEGRLTVGTGASVTVLRPARWWEPATVRQGVPDAGALAEAERVLAGLPVPSGRVGDARAAGRAAARALAAGRPDEAAERLVRVLGLGPGTTPSGDDVAAGVLLAAVALLGSGGAVRRLGDALLAAAPSRTGCVSLAMLTAATGGRAAAVVVAAVDALTGHGSSAAAVAALLRLGVTSGADLACGATAVGRALRDSGVRTPVAAW